jgi:hypothetical protein
VSSGANGLLVPVFAIIASSIFCICDISFVGVYAPNPNLLLIYKFVMNKCCYSLIYF